MSGDIEYGICGTCGAVGVEVDYFMCCGETIGICCDHDCDEEMT